MIRHGKAPYVECSSAGDKRFSAFYAIVNGKSIEEQYQAAKIFEDGTTGLGWRAAKGKAAVNMSEVTKLYGMLWHQYILEHPELLPVLARATGLSDRYGQPGHVCQATALWQIREIYLTYARTIHDTGMTPEAIDAMTKRLKEQE